MDAKTERTLRIEGIIRFETRWAATGEIIPEESGVVHNIITDAGLSELASILAEEAETVDFEIGVGTGTTTPAVGDTALVASVYEAVVTSKSQSGAVATYKLFLSTANANGSTLAEVGLKHNDVLIDRALISPTIAKTSAKTVTIQIDLTLSR